MKLEALLTIIRVPRYTLYLHKREQILFAKKFVLRHQKLVGWTIDISILIWGKFWNAQKVKAHKLQNLKKGANKKMSYLGEYAN